MGVTLKKKAERYSRLTVLSKNAGWSVDGKGRRSRLWRLRCVCGSIVTKVGARVKVGGTKSCGCLRREIALVNCARANAAKRFKHPTTLPDGRSTPEYNSYHAMRGRCFNPAWPGYERYGGRKKGRAIGMCARWCGPGGFDNFVDDLGPRPKGTTLHRHPNNADYTPETCSWVGSGVQQNNRSDCRPLTLGEKTHTMAEWARIIGMAYSTLCNRVHRKWPDEAVLTLPPGSKLKDWKPCKDTE